MDNQKWILISNQKNWVEQAAKDQLAGVSRLEGVVRAVGLPDLHPGKTPVGMAVLSDGRFYPHLIGNDIGCGMSLFSTGVPVSANRDCALTAFTARALCVAAFLIYWASSII